MRLCWVQNNTIRGIALKLNRSKTTIQNYLRDPISYRTISRHGPIPVIIERDKRQIKRLAVSENISCGQIKSKMNQNVTVRRINQILNKDFNITKRKMIPKPKLTPRHTTSRLEFAEKYKFLDEK